MSIKNFLEIVNNINSALDIPILDSRILNYIERCNLKSKIKENVKNYIDNSKYIPNDFSKEFLNEWIVEYGIDYIIAENLSMRTNNSEVHTQEEICNIIYSKLSGRKEINVEYNTFKCYFYNLVKIIIDTLYENISDELKVLNMSICNYIEKSKEELLIAINELSLQKNNLPEL